MRNSLGLWATSVLLMAFWVQAARPQGGDPNGGPQPVYRHQITVPGDEFQSWTSPAFIKFTILVKPGFDPNVVFFQDSRRYEYHFDFATEHLDPFLGMTQAGVDQVTMYARGQEAVLGAVILPPTWGKTFNEYGIQLTRYDAYTKEEAARWFSVVKAAIVADPAIQAWYFPTYEQLTVAQQNRDWFADQGMPIGSTAQWAEGNTAYADGWAVGPLRFVEGGRIQSAFARGDLATSDLLLTDGVPADVPPLAGIMTLRAATPNSHVAILCRSKGIPFVHLAMDPDVAKAQAFVGRRVYLSVIGQSTGGGMGIEILDVNDMEPDLVASLLSLKDAPAVQIQPMRTYGGLCADTEGLTPNHIPFFGGKASNYGVLRRAIPDNCPRAMAFSFDLWNAFLDQVPTGGSTTLRQRIAERLASYTQYPPSDMEALSSELAAIRNLFTDTRASTFSTSLRQGVLDALEAFGFDPKQNIRFRSSTNVEDSDRFTGAGLYDSYSGCLADDLDADDAGPCTCDPVEAKERGVFRAVRKVFASFYNDNALLERL